MMIKWCIEIRYGVWSIHNDDLVLLELALEEKFRVASCSFSLSPPDISQVVIPYAEVDAHLGLSNPVPNKG